MHVNPDLLVSGINDGQNISPPVSNVSGTIGAARQGTLADIPAVALSAGFGRTSPLPVIPPDFPSAAALSSWVNDFLLGRAEPAVFESVVNINAPTCYSGTIRGTRVLPLSPTLSLAPSNCLSTVTNPADDVAGFLDGFITVTSVGTEGSVTS